MPTETRRRERGHAFYPPADKSARIPRVYATEHVPFDDKVLHLHYFTAACDWWIAEYDPESGRAFGYACLNGDARNAEWGAIDLTELESVRVGPIIVGRDLNWSPTLARDARLPGWCAGNSDQEHRFVVTVTRCTGEQALQVMSERVGHDADYGFPYAIDWTQMS